MIYIVRRFLNDICKDDSEILATDFYRLISSLLCYSFLSNAINGFIPSYLLA